MNFEKIIKICTYLGLMPLVVFTIILLDFAPVKFNLSMVFVFFIYISSILFFIFGKYWGVCLANKDQKLAFYSIIIFIIYFLSFVFVAILSNGSLLVLFNALFLALILFFDKLLLSKDYIEGWYFKLRCRVSIIFIVILVLDFFLLNDSSI